MSEPKFFNFLLNGTHPFNICSGNYFPALHKGDVITCEEFNSIWVVPLAGVYVFQELPNKRYGYYRVGA